MYTSIKRIHLELTERCQAACPLCARTVITEKGPIDNPKLISAELSLSDIQQILPPSLIKQLESIMLCGNYGDPIVAKDCLNIIRYFRTENKNIFLSMHTNGGARDVHWWEELAILMGMRSRVTFSVDGLSDTNHIYRRNVSWEKIEQAMQAYSNIGAPFNWHFLIFKHNEHQIEQARKKAKELNCEIIFKKTSRFYHVMNNETVDVIKFRDNTKLELPTNPEYVNKYINKNEEDNVIQCEVKPRKEIFISARGLILPCCYIGSVMYRNNNSWGNTIQDLIEDENKINAFKRPISEIIKDSFIKSLPEKWKSCEPKVCAEYCGKKRKIWKAQYE